MRIFKICIGFLFFIFILLFINGLILIFDIFSMIPQTFDWRYTGEKTSLSNNKSFNIIAISIITFFIGKQFYKKNPKEYFKIGNPFLIGFFLGCLLFLLLNIISFTYKLFKPKYNSNVYQTEMTEERISGIGEEEYLEREKEFEEYLEREKLEQEKNAEEAKEPSEIITHGVIVPSNGKNADSISLNTLSVFNTDGLQVAFLFYNDVATLNSANGYYAPSKIYDISINYISAEEPQYILKQWTSTYINNKNGLLEISDGLWIKEYDLKKKGFRSINIMKYLIEKTDEVMGYYPNSPGINLYTSPSTSSNVVLNMEGDLYDISLINEISGRWCKVEVNQYKEHPCGGGTPEELIINHFSGWIILVDEEMNPRVYNYDKGC